MFFSKSCLHIFSDSELRNSTIIHDTDGHVVRFVHLPLMHRCISCTCIKCTHVYSCNIKYCFLLIQYKALIWYSNLVPKVTECLHSKDNIFVLLMLVQLLCCLCSSYKKEIARKKMTITICATYVPVYEPHKKRCNICRTHI